ncbi:MAG: hypothetical protein NT157_01125, partial [Candidatus Micrarchaeota archaeon]|nr:hypothetical protein [Candidatus Micrarchaeota archaeon]
FGRVIASSVVLALPGRLEKFASCFRASDKRIMIAMLAVNTAAVVLYNYAITLGPVTIVEAISGFYPFFVLLFAAAFARWMPSLLEERLAGWDLALKVFAITLMLVGLAVLYL